MQKRDYRSLYLIQNKLLQNIAHLDLPFYLTGGTALGRFYLNHRYSEDLDFFVNDDRNFPRYISIISKNLKGKFILDESETVVADDFARFLIIEDDNILKMEFINDVPFRTGLLLEYNGIKIDSVSNILANKLTAIISRDEPKDICDILFISINYSFNWMSEFLNAKEKALINELDVARRLDDFPVELLDNVDWSPGIPENLKYKGLLKQISNDFILGLDNSAGKGKAEIGKAFLLNNPFTIYDN